MNQNSPASAGTADVVVIGGGLAGLTAAATVAKSGRSVLVLERHTQVGGRARSSTKEGFVFNEGPHALYAGGAAHRILLELGVTIAGGPPPGKGQVVFGATTELFPSGPIGLLRTGGLAGRDKVALGRTLARLPRMVPANHAHLTVNEWVDKAVSTARSAEFLHALVRLATYVHQPDQLSADVAIAQIQLAVGNGVIYVDRGWQSMVDQLKDQPGIQFQTGPVAELPEARTIIVATGGPQAANALLGTTFDVGPAANASCLDLGLTRRPTHDFVLGGDQPFYFSNHSAAADLAPDGRYHAAAVQYLADGESPDADGLDAFPQFAGVQESDIVTRRRLHRMETVTAISTASRGGRSGRPLATDSGHPNVFIAGDWVGPEGHLADASVASGAHAATLAMQALEAAKR